MMRDDEIGVGAAAELLGVDPSTVARWVDEGRLAGYRTSERGPRRIKRASLEAELARQQHGRDPAQP